MKITVSYINSKFNINETINKVNKAKNINGFHADLMDGLYVENKNFDLVSLKNNLSKCAKKIDVHLMTFNPEEYLDTLCALNTNIIFFHPKTTKDPTIFIEKIKQKKRIPGIVINPDEDILCYNELYSLVGAVLVMSVVPGKGGQRFLRKSLVNYELIRELRDKYHFLLYVDGGINDETIKYIKESDGVVVGSYICLADDYDAQANNLINSLNNN